MPIYKTKIKKDGLQQYRVRVSYTDTDGKYRQLERTAYGKAEAQELERRLQTEASTPKVSRQSYTLRQLAEDYSRSRKGEVRQSTLEKSDRIICLHILPELGAQELSALDPQMLTKWKLGIKSKQLSTVSTQNIYGSLNALLNFAVKMGALETNPLQRVGNFRSSEFAMPQDKLHYYTPEQFAAYISVAADRCSTLMDCGVYVFFCIAYYTGMRKGEINALKWIDIEERHINVRRSVCQKIKGESVVETPPKNRASYRTLQIPLPLLDVLEVHRKLQQQDTRFSPEWRVCGGPKCLSDSLLSNRNAFFADAAGLPHIRIHDFRHSHASLLVNSGVIIQEVSRRLGHSDVQMTWNTYSHLYPKADEYAVGVLNQVLLPPAAKPSLLTPPSLNNP